VVGLAHRYGLEGAEINSGGDQFFRTSPYRLWAYLASGYWVIPGNSHPHVHSAEVKERVQLYLYSPSVPSWQVVE